MIDSSFANCSINFTSQITEKKRKRNIFDFCKELIELIHIYIILYNGRFIFHSSKNLLLQFIEEFYLRSRYSIKKKNININSTQILFTDNQRRFNEILHFNEVLFFHSIISPGRENFLLPFELKLEVSLFPEI